MLIGDQLAAIIIGNDCPHQNDPLEAFELISK